MRTTLTIDDDLADSLKEQARQNNLPFKQVVNETLRRGLSEAPNGDRPPSRVEPVGLGGLRPGIDPTKLNQLSDELELQEFIEKQKRLSE